MWWWIADLIGATILLPALTWSVFALLRPIREIDTHLQDVLTDLNATVDSLGGIPGLAETVMLTSAGRPGAERYGEALRSTR